MNMEDKIRALIENNYKSIREFAKIIDTPYTTILSMLKKGIGGTGIDTVLKVCKELGISADGLHDDSAEEITCATPEMNNIKETVAKNLKHFRLRGKMTQSDLASELNVKHNTVSSWEKGSNSIDIEILFKICNILKVSINDMYGVQPKIAYNLTEDEKKIVDLYRNSTEKAQGMIEGILMSNQIEF